ncbi:MAG: DNA-processing protein DprA [Treponema sp.]|nr:DNA-processing protein DprA [Treponema sp.]
MLYIQNNSDEKLILDIYLARITFLSCKEKNILSKKLDSSYSLALLSIEEIFKFLDRPVPLRAEWNAAENLEAAKHALYICRLRGINLLHNEDAMYPEMLRNIDDPPYLLFYRGDASLLTEKSVSVVGTRRLTPEGKKAAHKFAYDAVCDGVNVVSGLAYGADGCAHLGAVNAFYDGADGGKTIAVLPCAADEIVPCGQRFLAEKILKSGGCILSEYEPGMQMASWHYVARNRIVAALSPAVVVVEAPVGSGALITADLALESGRDVFFHETAVSQMAQKVSLAVKRDLEVRFAKSEVSKYKIENTIEKYLEAGASIITSYADYKAALLEVPGVRSVRQALIQGELF